MYQLPIDMTTRIPRVKRATMSPPRQSASRPYGLSTTSVARIDGAAGGRRGRRGSRFGGRGSGRGGGLRLRQGHAAAGPSASRRGTGPRPGRPIGSSSAWCLQAINDSVRKPGYGPTGSDDACVGGWMGRRPRGRLMVDSALPAASRHCAGARTVPGELRGTLGECAKTHWPRSAAGPGFVGKSRDFTRMPDDVQTAAPARQPGARDRTGSARDRAA